MNGLTIAPAFAALLLISAQASAATAPAAGQYHAVLEVVSVSNTQSQDPCYDTITNNYFPDAQLQYGGPAATSLVLLNPINVPSETQPYGTTGVSKQVLTVTAGAGTVKPSGSFTWTSSPAEIATHGRWHATFSYIDASSFRGTLVESYAGQAGGTCTEQDSVAFIKTN